MAHYTIQVLNNSGGPKSYFVFMEQPTVTGSGDNPKVWSNAWVTFNSISDGSWDEVEYTDLIYALWGRTPAELATGVILTSGGSVLVDPSQRPSVPFIGAPPVGFGPVTAGGAPTGSFAIVATDFNLENNYVFGMAKPGKTPIPSPVATFLANPNDTFDVTPGAKFYINISDQTYIAGQVIDFSISSTDAAAIDFTGKPQTTATVIQKADGSFAVQYS